MNQAFTDFRGRIFQVTALSGPNLSLYPLTHTVIYFVCLFLDLESRFMAIYLWFYILPLGDVRFEDKLIKKLKGLERFIYSIILLDLTQKSAAATT